VHLARNIEATELPFAMRKPLANGDVSILTYHSVAPTVPRRLRAFRVHPHHFEDQARHIRAAGYCTLTVSELVNMRAAGALPEKSVVLTFDDGFADFHTQVLPVLSRYGLKATLYVVAGYVGDTSRWLEDEESRSLPMVTWSQLRDIAKSGVEIGAHTMSHPSLDSIDLSHARIEITESKRALEDGLGISVESFAYPYGNFSGAVRDLVVAAGYASACAVGYATSSPRDDRFALSRHMVRDNADLPDFDALLEGRPALLRCLGDRARSTAWTYVRHTLNGSR
jgi:peptidoglycan/xylan/chitin deacetylase (PgdA/CDA1 family)